MINIEELDVSGFEDAILGMRNPMKSRDKSDSEIIYRCDPTKNVECTKESCRWLNNGECTGTKNVNFAELNRNLRPVVQEIYDVEET